MLGCVIFLVIGIVIDIHAMEQQLNLDETLSLHSAEGVTQTTSFSDASDSDYLSKKHVNFSLGSIISSTSSESLGSRSSGSMELLSKKSFSKKKGYFSRTKGM